MADSIDFSKFMSMDPDQQKAMGVQALMSGKVSPDEVSQAQTLISHPAFAAAIKGGQPVPPNAFAQAVTGAPNTVTQPSSLKKQTTADSKSVKTNKTGGSTNTYATGEAFANRLKGVEDLPEVADERASIKQAQDRLDMQRGQAGAMGMDNTAWIRPLAAYVDSTQGTKLSAAANALPSQADKLAGVNSSQDALIKRKNDLAKLIFDGSKQLKDGTTTNQISLVDQRGDKSVQGDNMNGVASARMAVLPINAGKDFDKQLAASTKSVEAFNRGESFLNNPNIPLTDTTLNQVQQDISNGLSGSGQATDAKTAMDLQENIAGIIQRAKTKYTGTIGPKDDLRLKIPDVVDQIRKALVASRQEYYDNINRQAGQISKNYESSFGAVPNLRETVEGKRAYIESRFPKSEHFSETGVNAPTAQTPGVKAAPPPATLSRDQLAKLSPAEFDAYEAAHLAKGG